MAHLDMSQISELKDLMEDAFTDLVDTYLEDCDEKIIKLSAAVAAQDASISADISHSLKGSSANICAAELSALFKNIEDQARDNDLSQLEDQLSAAQAEYDQVKAQLQSLC